MVITASTSATATIHVSVAIQYRKFPTILNRPEPARLMGVKVGESHLAGQYKCHGTRKEANQEQQPAKRFEHPRSPHQGKERSRRTSAAHAAKQPEQLLKAMQKKRKANQPTLTPLRNCKRPVNWGHVAAVERLLI
jgi:hypothetical protein